MNIKTIPTSYIFLKSISIFSLLILIIIAGITYRHSMDVSQSTKAVVHSHKVHFELEQLISYLKDAETGQRGYIITHDTTFLEPYNGANQKVDESFKTLKFLMSDNPKQQANLDTLNQLIDIRFRLFTNSLRESFSQKTITISLNDRLIEGKKVMDKIRSHINGMIGLELIYLKERQEKYEYEISYTPIFTVILLIFSLLVFLFSFYMFNRDLIVLTKSNEELVISTESIKHAEVIGEFSSWQWDLKNNKLTYSDNFYRLLGCEPQSFEANVENFLQFVHPEDKSYATNASNEALNDKKTEIRFFRIIRRDGEIRYFKSIGKWLSDFNDKNTLIGITSDVTDQHLSNIVLRNKNRELEQSNTELASFNHIASHDLQEPLRKIQLFVSRINDSELSLMTENGKEYFTKIEKSANRMRTLIDDLLLFSRINKHEKVYKKTNLNKILEEVTQELAETITEKKAIINSAKLPTLTIIPFQIQQLFVNLIGNSLKYCKLEPNCVIDIACERVLAKDYVILKKGEVNEYFKISISDNGVGFEQKYAENVFILFSRLHHKAEYSGTGIGLAICKKIVENHGGFITAESVVDKGSTFSVFLPA